MVEHFRASSRAKAVSDDYFLIQLMVLALGVNAGMKFQKVFQKSENGYIHLLLETTIG